MKCAVAAQVQEMLQIQAHVYELERQHQRMRQQYARLIFCYQGRKLGLLSI